MQIQIGERNSHQTVQFTLAILNTCDEFCCTESFDCGNEDLNEFFQKDAFAHKQELLAETYFLQPTEATEKDIFLPVAFVSFLNDAIVISRKERRGSKIKFWNHLKKHIPQKKRLYPSFPAVKIGRLGVLKEYQRQHIGTSLLNMTKDMFLTNNRTGCRFLTVDAANNKGTISFYKKNGFDFLLEDDPPDKRARIMFFDLKRHRDNF